MTALADRDDATPTGTRRRRDRRPRLQRGGRPRAERAPAARLPATDTSRSRAIITIADNASTDATWAVAHDAGRASSTACAPCTSTPRAAAGRCTRCGRASTRARRRLHGRRPLDRPQRAAAAGRAAAVRAQRRRDRHAGCRRSSRVVRGPKREFISRSLQPAAAHHAARPLLRRPVRLQGDARRVRAGAAAARAGHRVVLRHRTAGARRAQRPAHRRGAGRLGRRSGQPRRHRRRPRWPTCAASPGSARRCCAATLPVRELRAAARPRPQRAVPASAGSPAGDALRRRRRAQHARLPRCCSCCCARAARRAGREPARAAGHRDRQHRRRTGASPSASAAAAHGGTSCRACVVFAPRARR